MVKLISMDLLKLRKDKEMNNKPKLTVKEARKIISALRKGTPPEFDVDFFSVGREEMLSYFNEKFEEIKEYDLSDIKFISADYGQGKSHFLDLLQNMALHKNFVVSNVSLHSKETPFDQLQIVIQSIMANIITPKFHQNGLEALLNEWVEKYKDVELNTVLAKLLDDTIYPDMRKKLVEYRRFYSENLHEECLNSLKWFEGKETKSKTFRNVKEFLHNFIIFIRSLGYSGLILMFDEAEAITSLSRIDRRDVANENIRQIIDNDSNTEGFYFIFASTPSFLSGEGDRGASEYRALWRRISDPLQDFQQNSYHKIIIELPNLNESEFLQIAEKIKTIYEKAYNKNLSNISEEELKILSGYVHKFADNHVGTMVRSTVVLLQEATNSEFNFEKRFEIIVESVKQLEEIDRAK